MKGEVGARIVTTMPLPNIQTATVSPHFAVQIGKKVMKFTHMLK